jgi:hypothetical protein
MNTISRAFQTIRVWMGLADASESHLTPDHGWLLPAPADARRRRENPDAARAERSGERKAQA